MPLCEALATTSPTGPAPTINGSASTTISPHSQGKRLLRPVCSSLHRPLMSTDPAATALALKALQLLGRWSRFTNAFKPSTPTCPCCIGLGTPSIAAWELGLVSHLSKLHVGNDTVAQLLREKAGYEQGAAGSATNLLQALARRSLTAPIDAQWMLVNDIEATLDRLEGASVLTGSEA